MTMLFLLLKRHRTLFILMLKRYIKQNSPLQFNVAKSEFCALCNVRRMQLFLLFFLKIQLKLFQAMYFFFTKSQLRYSLVIDTQSITTTILEYIHASFQMTYKIYYAALSPLKLQNLCIIQYAICMKILLLLFVELQLFSTKKIALSTCKQDSFQIEMQNVSLLANLLNALNIQFSICCNNSAV